MGFFAYLSIGLGCVSIASLIIYFVDRAKIRTLRIDILQTINEAYNVRWELMKEAELVDPALHNDIARKLDHLNQKIIASLSALHKKAIIHWVETNKPREQWEYWEDFLKVKIIK